MDCVAMTTRCDVAITRPALPSTHPVLSPSFSYTNIISHHIWSGSKKLVVRVAGVNHQASTTAAAKVDRS